MTALQIFKFEEQEVRTQIINDEPWFVAKDVAEILGYSETNAMTKRLDEEDSISTKLSGMNMKSLLINESGMYSAIIGSKLPSAKKFKRWVTSEVLPTIRKHGAYMTEKTIEDALLNPDTLIQLATNLKEERTKRLVAEQQVMELKPKADYYDSILSNKGLVTISTIAKNYGYSAGKFNELLHKLGIQYKQGKTWLLYQKHATSGYTHSEPFGYIDKEGKDQVTMNTKWTTKGHIFIYQELKKNEILPMIERNEKGA